MRIHAGLGPVFSVEWAVNARKWHGYAARFLFGMALLFCITIASWGIGSITSKSGVVTIGTLSSFGETLFEVMGTIQLLMVLLAAPAATAGAICQDRARGALVHMLVTDLTDSEIVLGKLAARLVPVLGLVFCSFPVMALSSLFGGIDPRAITTLLAISVALAVLGCTLALTISLWVKKTHETLMGVLGLWMIWFLAYPFWMVLQGLIGLGPAPKALIASNPFFLMYAIYSVPSYPVTAHVVWFVTATLALSAVLLIVTIRRLRSSIERDGQSRSKRGTRRSLWKVVGGWFEPHLEPNPVLWRECHRNRPSRFARILWFVYLVLATSLTAFAIVNLMRRGIATGRGSILLELTLINAFQISFGLLLVSVGAPTALAEERVRGSLDLLLSTPLSTRTILAGKWWGAFRIVPWLTILPVVSAFTLALITPTTSISGPRGVNPSRPPIADLHLGDRVGIVIIAAGQTLAYGAAITSLGLAMATWTPRVGRAVASCVSIYVLVAFLWPLATEILSELVLMWLSSDVSWMKHLDPEIVFIGIASSSPFVATVGRDITLLASLTRYQRMAICTINFAWISFMFLFAGVLFELTVRVFDRRLGRVSDRGIKVPSALKANSKPGLLRRWNPRTEQPGEAVVEA